MTAIKCFSIHRMTLLISFKVNFPTSIKGAQLFTVLNYKNSLHLSSISRICPMGLRTGEDASQSIVISTSFKKSYMVNDVRTSILHGKKIYGAKVATWSCRISIIYLCTFIRLLYESTLILCVLLNIYIYTLLYFII